MPTFAQNSERGHGPNWGAVFGTGVEIVEYGSRHRHNL